MFLSYNLWDDFWTYFKVSMYIFLQWIIAFSLFFRLIIFTINFKEFYFFFIINNLFHHFVKQMWTSFLKNFNFIWYKYLNLSYYFSNFNCSELWTDSTREKSLNFNLFSVDKIITYSVSLVIFLVLKLRFYHKENAHLKFNL